ncbi:MAG: hypothetical protein QXM52_06985 [Candidatus Bathyarchaeia archaeon]
MESLTQDENVEKLKAQWKKLWRERIDDKLKAEGIANEDYPMLFVDKGTVIIATRDFKMLSFKEILELNGVINAERFIAPSPSVGGWGKFIRTFIVGKGSSRRVESARHYLESEKQRQQLKKGGRGWLHLE